MRKRNRAKTIVIIAGPNGAGKTTFARKCSVDQHEFPDFINADMIARGLSPVDPNKVSIAAGKDMLREIHQRVSRGDSFVFETTLSGLNYSRHIPNWRKKGYHVRLIFLALPSADAAVARVKIRMEQGGHGVPETVIRRRFELGKRNFENVYRKMVDSWVVYDNSDEHLKMIARKP
jgi:predicted ABC-type ATPase